LEHSNLQTVTNERFDRMEQHLRLVKVSLEAISEDSKKMSIALIGNEFTAGEGLVHRMKRIDDCNEKNKDDIALLKDNMNLVKWIGSAIGGLILAIVLYVLQSKI